MEDKMRECGMVNCDLVPNGALPFDYDPRETEESLFRHTRDIDILFVGALYRQKLSILTAVAQRFGSRFIWKGRVPWKHNAYLSLRYGRLFMARPVTRQRRDSTCAPRSQRTGYSALMSAINSCVTAPQMERCYERR
jgi:hypothetical protein